MPLSEQIKRRCLQAALLFWALEIFTWIVKSITRVFDNFSVKWGVDAFILFQGFGCDILVNAYRAWRGTATWRVVQNQGAECAGHLLNYVLQSLVLFVFGGYDNKKIIEEYAQIGINRDTMDSFDIFLTRELCWMKYLSGIVFVICWGIAFADMPWLSQRCILFADRLRMRFDSGPTKAQLAA